MVYVCMSPRSLFSRSLFFGPVMKWHRWCMYVCRLGRATFSRCYHTVAACWVTLGFAPPCALLCGRRHRWCMYVASVGRFIFQYDFWRHCVGSLFSRSLFLDVCLCVAPYFNMTFDGTGGVCMSPRSVGHFFRGWSFLFFGPKQW